MLTLSSWSGALAQRIGPRLPMTVGPLGVAAGLLLFSRVGPGTSYFSAVLPAALVFGAGLVLTVAPLTATVLAAVDDARVGVASGVNNAVSRLAGLLAVALLPRLVGLDTSGVGDVDALDRRVPLGDANHRRALRGRWVGRVPHRAAGGVDRARPAGRDRPALPRLRPRRLSGQRTCIA